MMNNTLDYYEGAAENYIADTKNIDMTTQCDEFISLIPRGGVICDLGCGSCRDTLYFISKGFVVVPIDGSKSICKEAEKLTGQKVVCQNFLEFDYTNKFDGVWACASIHHLLEAEFVVVLKKIAKSLKRGGVFYFSAKLGENSFVDGKGRHFLRFNEASFKKLLSNTGVDKLLKCSSCQTSGDQLNRPDTCWFNAILEKENTNVKSALDNTSEASNAGE